MSKATKNPSFIGQRFSRLTVVGKTTKEVHHKGNTIIRPACIVRCDCGKEKTILENALKSGGTTSCGCFHKEVMRKLTNYKTKHGMTKTPTYRSWVSMIDRCTNPNHIQYKDYQGRGITICKEWFTFENFYADMGVRPEGLTLERKDNDKGYCKENCIWATRKQQALNRSIRSDNKTGITGVTIQKTTNYWLIFLGKGKTTTRKDFFEACCLRKSYELNRGNNG